MIVCMNCGLGNQMFQYAFGEAMRLNKGYNVEYDLRWFREKEKQGTKRNFDLAVFGIKLKEHKSSFKYDFNGKGVMKRISNKLYSLFIHPVVFERKICVYDSDLVDSIKEHSLIYGFFQNEDYFIKHEEYIRKTFEFKVPLTENAGNYLKYVSNPKAVALHVRRGDFLKYSNMGTCSLDYYERAIKIIQERVDQPLFLIFSDDVDWVKKQDCFLRLNSVIVSGNKDEYAYEDLRLMSMCSHCIMANSTFSWWGAWLINNPNKIIIAPSRWFANEEMNAQARFITPSKWIRL